MDFSISAVARPNPHRSKIKVPEPTDKNFVAKVRREIAEADKRAKEVADEYNKLEKESRRDN